MTISPYQHQDPRQIALQRQIEQARQEGDIQSLERLELLWVHRHGVASLPVAGLQIDQSDVPQDTPESLPVEVSQAEVERFLGQASVDPGDQDPPILNDQEPSIPEGVGPVPVASPQRLRRWLKPLNRSESTKAS